MPILDEHNPRIRIGIGIDGKEDKYGLYVIGEINLEVQAGREKFALIKQAKKHNMPYGLSIGFMTVTETIKQSIRVLQELKLFEWSPVSFPAAPNAGITDLRNAATLDGLCMNCGAVLDEMEPQDLHSILEDLRNINKTFKGG